MNPFSDAARWFSATQVLDRRRRDPQMSRRKRCGRSRAFAAMLEPLEDRIVLNVSCSVGGTTITFTSDSASDNLSLQTTSSGVLEYTDSSQTTPTTTSPTFTVGSGTSIIVSESGGTLNLQNLDTQGGSFEVNNDVTVTGSLKTEGGAVKISGGTGGTITVNSTLVSGSSGTLTGPKGQTFTIQSSTGTGDNATMTVAPMSGTTGTLTDGEQVTYAGSDSGLTAGSTYAVDVPDSSSPNTIQLYQQTTISTSSTTGTAGAILLDAPTITIGPYTQLLANGSSSSGDGTITLTATDTDTGQTYFSLANQVADLLNPNFTATISIDQNVVITGGDVSLTATSGDNSVLANSTSADSVAAAIGSPIANYINQFLSLPISVLVTKATATTEIGQSASIQSSGSVTVSSSATANSTGEAT